MEEEDPINILLLRRIIIILIIQMPLTFLSVIVAEGVAEATVTIIIIPTVDLLLLP